MQLHEQEKKALVPLYVLDLGCLCTSDQAVKDLWCLFCPL